MWARLVKRLCCPFCQNSFELRIFQEARTAIGAEDAALARCQGLFDADFDRYVDAGLLICHLCKTWFPILRGLPVLLPYTTPLHAEFVAQFHRMIAQLSLSYVFPTRRAVPGEQFVLRSFSKEWLDYKYDGVIWELSYKDLEKRFLNEVGFSPDKKTGHLDFLEIGCGLGITTYFASAKYKADAVGVDLSLAALRATEQYKTNPFVHFVQASVFCLPFAAESFDMLYSRGVLHHTYSTENAFRAVARCCRTGGSFYLWVYGKGSIQETLFRRLAFAGEALTRPLLSRSPDGWLANAFLSCMGIGYMAFNASHRLWNSEIQPLNFGRAVHAARDRFTPRYAFRQSPEELVAWFREVGFEDIQVVDWRIMPRGEQEDYRRNVGIRGLRRR
jgi:SAM-dependent methyltransferase/uncharacterized protein YbaR (Trm112 family)